MRSLQLQMRKQPDDTTCGPTCLHAIYRYWGDRISLDRVVREVEPLEGGGTLAVLLANHALDRGYRCTIYTYNLQMFDPSWFHTDGVDIAACLRAQARAKRAGKLGLATRAYLHYLEMGGVLRQRPLDGKMIRRYLNHDRPLLTGLSSTYLYDSARETAKGYDDIRGEPQGHFVVLAGYQTRRHRILVADPLKDNPRYGSHHYAVGMERLLASIFLGIVTYDANLLVIEPA